MNLDLYNEVGHLILQINWSNHGNSKKHPFGKIEEHKHIISWNNGKMRRGKAQELTK